MIPLSRSSGPESGCRRVKEAAARNNGARATSFPVQDAGSDGDLSHRHEDDALIGKLKSLLARNGADVRDSSVNESNFNNAKDPDYIKSLLADRINWAGTMFVLVTPDTKDHEWVDWEIEYANKHEKRIIGAWGPDSEGCELPEALQFYADAVVEWDDDAIIAALHGADNWHNPDGTERETMPISRKGC